MGFWRKEQITIFLTTTCNLGCVYCYMPKSRIAVKDRTIDVNFARRGIADFFANSDSKTIRFFGTGEPTVEFDVMKELYSYAKKLAGNDLRIELETNGYFSSDVADWIEEFVDYLWISCDGPPTIQDKQRPTLGGKGSSEIVVRNIKRFAKNKRMQFGVRATIDAKYIENQIELIDYFGDLGVRYVAASPTYHSKVNKNIQTPSLFSFAKYFLPGYLHAKRRGMFYQTLFMVNFDEEVEIYCQAQLPTPRLTTDGYVSSCDWASMGPKYLPDLTQQQLVYGRYIEETGEIQYDEKKIEGIRKRNKEYLGRNQCAGCRAISHCVGGCVGKMAAATNDIYKASEQWCKAVLYLFDNMQRDDNNFPFLHP